MEINENKLKTILKEQRTGFETFVNKNSREQEKKYETYVGTIAEDFGSKLSVVAEDVLSMKGKLDKVGNRLDYVAEMVARNTEDIEIMKTTSNLSSIH